MLVTIRLLSCECPVPILAPIQPETQLTRVRSLREPRIKRPSPRPVIHFLGFPKTSASHHSDYFQRVVRSSAFGESEEILNGFEQTP